jgi:hypothetical protein
MLSTVAYAPDNKHQDIGDSLNRCQGETAVERYAGNERSHRLVREAIYLQSTHARMLVEHKCVQSDRAGSSPRGGATGSAPVLTLLLLLL